MNWTSYYEFQLSKFQSKFLKIFKTLKILLRFSRFSKIRFSKNQFSIFKNHFTAFFTFTLGQAGKLIELPCIISCISLYRFSHTFNCYVLLSEYLFDIYENPVLWFFYTIKYFSLNAINWSYKHCPPSVSSLDYQSWIKVGIGLVYWGAMTDEEIQNQRSNWLQEVKYNCDQGN